MDDIEDLLESLSTLYAKLAALKALEGLELLLPGRTTSYRATLEDAYGAYNKVETTVDALGQAVENERIRLDRAVQRYGSEKE